MASALQRHAARVARNERTSGWFLRVVGGISAGTVLTAAALASATPPTLVGSPSPRRPPARAAPGPTSTRPPATPPPTGPPPEATQPPATQPPAQTATSGP